MIKKILIIEDEIDILEALKVILESRGFNVIGLESYKNSDAIAKFMPDLILLDLLVAGQAGEAIAANIRKNRQTAQIPIVILSAQPLYLLKKSAKLCNAVNFLQKPFDISDLIQVVNNSVSP